MFKDASMGNELIIEKKESEIGIRGLIMGGVNGSTVFMMRAPKTYISFIERFRHFLVCMSDGLGIIIHA